MKKILLTLFFGLLLIVSGCSHQENKDAVGENIGVVNEKTNNIVSNNNSLSGNNVPYSSGGIYDKTIDDLVKSNYFSGMNIPTIISCADTITGELQKSEGIIEYFESRNINGTFFEEKSNCIKNNEKCNQEALLREENTIQEIINKNRFNVINGCLYDGANKALQYNLFAYMHTDFFGQKIEKKGERTFEWLRFEDNNNLYIFLEGTAGCAGCFFIGPHLLINLTSGKIEGKYHDGLYPIQLLFSPNKKIFLQTSWDEDGKNTKLYSFNLLNNQKEKLLYEIPSNTSIIEQSHGEYLVNDAITRIDDSTLQIQLYERNKDNYFVKTEYNENTGTKYFTSGDPVIVKINNE